jgi:L-ascorbate metabolism protein UlaG (beta-lactamase superfamily)
VTDIHYLGHSFFRLGFKDATVLIDPYINTISPDAQFRRLEKCPVKEKNLPKTDLILITQENFDHFDKKAVETIAMRDNATVIATQNILNELTLTENQKIAVGSGDTKRVKGLEVQVLDAHFPTSFYPVSYLVSDDKTSIYHAGASQDFSEHHKFKADVLLLPIGGTISMDVVDAVKVTKTVKPKFAIPMHYNTFGFIQVDPREFSHRIIKSILKTEPIILKPGEQFSL